jgi:bifunctional polynucleotide phosphatase/kinase
MAPPSRVANSIRYRVVIVSNQGGFAVESNAKASKKHHDRRKAFKLKVCAVFNQLDLPISIYAATEKDIYRKPRTGMWKEMLEDYDLNDSDGVYLESSFFVGDAGGRVAGSSGVKDISCSDRYVSYIPDRKAVILQYPATLHIMLGSGI